MVKLFLDDIASPTHLSKGITIFEKQNALDNQVLCTNDFH